MGVKAKMIVQHWYDAQYCLGCRYCAIVKEPIKLETKKTDFKKETLNYSIYARMIQIDCF
jgi:hypothetical protein